MLSSFGGQGSGDGQFSGAGGAALNQSSGDLYVVDVGNDRVQRFDAEGTYLSQFGSGGSGDGELNFNGFELAGVAVAPDGSVYVADVGNHRVQKFAADGTFVSMFGLDVDPGSPGAGVCTSGCQAGTAGAGDGEFSSPISVAVDPGSGDVLVADRDNNRVQRFDSSGAYESQFAGVDDNALTAPYRLAVDSTGAIFVLEQYARVQKFDATGTFEEVVGPDVLFNAPTDVSVDAATDHVYVVQYNDSFSAGDVVEFDDTGALLEKHPLPFAEASGSAVRSSTGRIYVADAFNSRAVILGFAAPEVETLAAAPRLATAAGLNGSVHTGNLETTYRFEYGKTTSYGVSVPAPDGSAGSSGEIGVSQWITGLEPQTTYHYRVVATNDLGSATGADRMFTTPAQAPAPTGRGYELVSPAYKAAGIGVGFTYRGPSDLADSGVAAYEGERFAALGQYGSMLLDTGVGLVTSWAFGQRTDAGWVNHNPFTHPLFSSQVTRMPGFTTATDDLARVVWEAQEEGPLPVFPEMAGGFNRPSLVGDWEGRWELLGPSAAVTQNSLAVVFSGDGSRAVMSGDSFGMAGVGSPDHPETNDRVAGHSVHVVDVSGPPADSFAGSGGGEALVNVCTGSGLDRTRLAVRVGDTVSEQACPEPAAGRSARLTSPYGATLRPQNETASSATNIVSADGSRVFFMSPDPALNDAANPGAVACTAEEGEATACPAQLFVRETDADGADARVRWISRPVDGLLGDQDASLLGPTLFEGASEDGDKVFFRTTSPLTTDDPNGNCGAPCLSDPDGGADPSSWDLYMYDLPDAPGADLADGQLTRISGGPGGASDCNNQQGNIESQPLPETQAASLRFASADGSKVYFVCAAPLTDADVTPPGGSVAANVPSGDATNPFPTETNLYRYDHDEAVEGQRWRFIAHLPRAIATLDATGVDALAACASTGGYQSQPLGGGGTISEARANCVRGDRDGSFVTFFTPAGLTPGDGGGETGDVYGYDAASDELARISAAQDGPGGSYECLSNPETFCNGDGGFDTSVHVPTAVARSLLGVVTDPDVAGDRVAFFQSASRLVAGDVNDVYDVYMWRNGELSLVSTGAVDAEHAIYKGNDRSGKNVYFTTRDSLTWQDVDAVADVYTARVGGGIPEPPAPVACAVLASECQGPVIGVPVSTKAESDKLGGDGNASPGARKTLTIAGLSKKARRRAARTGNLVVSVRTSEAGRVSAVAKGRVGKRTRRVARESVQVRKAGKARLKLRLNRAARQRLRGGRALKLSIKVTSPGARSQSMSVRLPGASS